MQTVFIDLREEFEVADVQIIPRTSSILVINIPMRNIFANTHYIEQLASQSKLVYLLCRSGVRSKSVKKLYFADNDNIVSYDGGWKQLEANEDNFTVIHKESVFNIGPQQLMHLVFVFILLSILGLNYYRLDRYYINIYLVALIVFILYQFFSKSCMLSSMLPLKQLE
jgi:rhodanese-related sulfurtransferase